MKVSSILGGLVLGGMALSTLAQSSGAPWAWGMNGNGQLGNGTVTDSNAPVEVLNLAGVTAIAGGKFHSLALENTGKMWAWGGNAQGQLGLGSIPGGPVPVQIPSLSAVAHIAAGSTHSLAVKQDGTVWAWGYNGYGQLGDGSFSGRSAPVLVLDLNGATAIAGGELHSIALKDDGTVWTWGRNNSGQLGDGTTALWSNYRVQVKDLTGATAVASGGLSWARPPERRDGASLGGERLRPARQRNQHGQPRPSRRIQFYRSDRIAGGKLHSLALRSDGTVWTWGSNTYGQLGNGTSNSSNIPVPVSNLTGVIAIAGGEFHSLALREDGTVWAWGRNDFGQLGNGYTGSTNSSTPVQALNLTHALAIAAGWTHSLALVGEVPCLSPTATTASAANVKWNSARLQGVANPMGCQASAYFEWGESPTYGNVSSPAWPIGAGTDEIHFWTDLDNLLPDTTYHVRAVVTSEGGLANGQDGTFTTRAACSLSCTTTVPAAGTVAIPIAFQSAAIASDCTGAPTFSWAFGDGGNSAEKDPSHTYTAAGNFSWTLTVTVDDKICTQSGSVSVLTVSGSPGDCDGDGQVSIGEVQKAINMFLGSQVVGCGVDCNGDGQVSIGEIQKVINSFLGIAANC